MKIEFPFPIASVTISLERGMCYGNCPVYTVTVDGTGEVIYCGGMFVKAEGEHRRNIGTGKVMKLLAVAFEIGFFDLKSKYEMREYIALEPDGMVCRQMEDVSCQPEYIVEIRIGDKKKRIFDYHGSPKRLRMFENMIDGVCGTREWLGDGDDLGR